MQTLPRTILASCVLLLCVACSGGEPAAAPAPAPAAPEPAPAAQAPAAPAAAAEPPSPEAAFKLRCSSCHGDSGKGDGPAAVALNPKPRDYTDKAWQESVTDEQIAKAITGGGPAVGKSPLMPAHPDLAQQPELLKGIVQHIRSFGGKGAPAEAPAEAPTEAPAQ